MIFKMMVKSLYDVTRCPEEVLVTADFCEVTSNGDLIFFKGSTMSRRGLQVVAAGQWLFVEEAEQEKSNE